MSPRDLLEALETIGDAPEGIERLRQLVLQLAVRGQLVPQDPDDEPATELVASLQPNLEALRADGRRRRKSKGMSGDPKPAPYELPSSWMWLAADELGVTVRGVTYKKSDASDNPADGTLPLLRAHNIQQSINYDKLVHVPIKLVNQQQILKVHDLLICMSSGSHSLVGKAAPVRADSRSTFGAFCSVFRPCSTTIAPYLAYFFRCPLYREGVAGDSRGIGINNLRSGDVESLLIPLPPLAEQHRIVAKVDELMALLDELERTHDERDARRAAFRDSALAALQNAEDAEAAHAAWSRIATNLADCITDPADIAPLRQTILQLAVRGRLVPQDPDDEPASELLKKIEQEKAELVRAKKIRKSTATVAVDSDRLPFPAPDGWIWASFSAVAAIASNLVNPAEYLSAPHVAPDNIQKATGRLLPYRTIREDGVTSNKHRFRAGQILYSKIRPNLAKAVVIEFAGLCSADMYPIEPLIDTTYLHRYLLSSTFLDEVTKGDNRLAMPKVNQDQLNGTPVPVPPLAEQRRIVAKVDELMAICDELEQRLTEAKTHQSAFAAAAVHHLQVDQQINSKQLAASK